jgi:hypothetical protein
MKVSEKTLISSAITGFSLEKCCVKKMPTGGETGRQKEEKRIYLSQGDL